MRPLGSNMDRPQPAKVPSAAAVTLGGRALSKLRKRKRTRALLRSIDRRKKRGSA